MFIPYTLHEEHVAMSHANDVFFNKIRCFYTQNLLYFGLLGFDALLSYDTSVQHGNNSKYLIWTKSNLKMFLKFVQKKINSYSAKFKNKFFS
jgi:hypothetical protein